MIEVDGVGILNRWHQRGHTEVPLDDVRRVRQLPLWLSLLTPGARADLDAAMAFLGLKGRLL